MARKKRGLDKRHRDKSGKIDRKHGNTRVKSLRKEYGHNFAKGRRSDLMLKNIAAGLFPTDIDSVTCPRCPHFFICSATPKGRLVLP